MVFGLVLGFLEGRRMNECMAAGLCASFILADGFTKSVGPGWCFTESPAPGCLFVCSLFHDPTLDLWLDAGSDTSRIRPMKKNVLGAPPWRRLIASVASSSTRPSCSRSAWPCAHHLGAQFAGRFAPELGRPWHGGQPGGVFSLKCGWLWGSCCAAACFRLTGTIVEP